MYLLFRRKAELIEEFFNAVVKENTGRAVHGLHPLVYEQVREKWKRVLELNAATRIDSEHSPQRQKASTQSQPSSNAGRGRGGSFVRGRGSFGPRGGGGGGRGGNRITPRSNFQGPPASLQGFRACFGFNNQQGCSRTMRDAKTCCEPGPNGAVYIHCCNFYDAVNKRHCLSTSHNRLTGGH
jgi:hypothetical protein